MVNISLKKQVFFYFLITLSSLSYATDLKKSECYLSFKQDMKNKNSLIRGRVISQVDVLIKARREKEFLSLLKQGMKDEHERRI